MILKANHTVNIFISHFIFNRYLKYTAPLTKNYITQCTEYVEVKVEAFRKSCLGQIDMRGQLLTATTVLPVKETGVPIGSLCEAPEAE
jgi:hypothetical protein